MNRPERLPVRTNRTRRKLASGEVVVGAVIGVPSPELVELAGALGFDFVSIDAEHEPIDDRQIAHMARAAEAFGVTPVVRLGWDPDRILRILDVGAQGIHVPRLNTGAQARPLVEWTRFHPQGKRTFYALGRSANYGIALDDADWARAANEELLLIASVEEVEGVERLPEILGVGGLDVIHIGPRDLWQSMGMPEQPEVDRVIGRIIAEGVAGGRWVSVQLRLGPGVEGRIAEYRRRGVRMVSVSLLDFIREYAPAFLKTVRGGPSGREP